MLDKDKNTTTTTTETTKITTDKRTAKKIDKFKRICQMEQHDLKKYLVNTLKSLGYDKIHNEDGYVYVKGETPVMLLAHMDTVHKSAPIIITVKNTAKGTELSSPFGIGGDDRCGIFMILEIVKDLKCSVLFTEDEEAGCVGAKKFASSSMVKDLGVNYMVEFDRRGKNDAVFYQCDNPEFTKFVTQEFFEEKWGSCSDISRVAPAAGIAAVNLSSGYYSEHTVDEYVIFEEMMKVVEEAKHLICKEVDKPFEYIEKTYSAFRGYSKGYNTYEDGWGWKWDDDKSKKKADLKTKKQKGGNKYFIEYYGDKYGAVYYDVVDGETEAEAWLEFCQIHGEICYDDVIGIYHADEVYDGFCLSRDYEDFGYYGY